MSRTRYSAKRPWKWPGWAKSLFVNKPFRRKLRVEERKVLLQPNVDEFVWSDRPKLPYWD